MRPWAAALVALALAGLLGGANLGAQTPAGAATLEGKLALQPPSQPVLVTAQKRYPLTASSRDLLRTLQDARLRHRQVRLAGTFEASGAFRVKSIFTLHDGQVYRIRYFCETCNIAALGPGRCVCCQQPTELQEYPAAEGDFPRPQDIIVIPRPRAR